MPTKASIHSFLVLKVASQDAEKNKQLPHKQLPRKLGTTSWSSDSQAVVLWLLHYLAINTTNLEFIKMHRMPGKFHHLKLTRILPDKIVKMEDRTLFYRPLINSKISLAFTGCFGFIGESSSFFSQMEIWRAMGYPSVQTLNRKIIIHSLGMTI